MPTDNGAFIFFIFQPLKMPVGDRLAPLGRRRRPGADLAQVESICWWMRRRFALSAETAVTVAQFRCAIEGCPPEETVVGFWSADGRYHRIRLHKPIAEVDYADIAWLIGSIEDHENGAWDCC